MKITKVTAVYYSAAGTTKRVTERIARALADKLGAEFAVDDFSLPASRQAARNFASGELVVFGTPVYAGRVPNKMLPEVQKLFKADGALAIPVVTFGNRNFDNGLIELRNELEKNGFHTVAGAGIACRHVFSDVLAAGRPDEEDLKAIDAFAASAAEKIKNLTDVPSPIAVRGDDPVGPYYTPLKEDGTPAKFLKAKPLTKTDLCDKCGKCVAACPMGSIDPSDPSLVPGLCIKCHACVRVCPTGAKYFADPDLASHIAMLEKNYMRRAEPEFFI